MRYRIKVGRWARVENGVLRRYKVGDPVELNEREAKEIAMLIEPFPAPMVPRDPGPPRRIVTGD